MIFTGTLALFLAGAFLDVDIFKDPAVISVTFVALTVFFFYAYYEDKKHDVKLIAMIASLSAIATGGRVLFAVIPNVQPATFVIAVSGVVFGPLPGFMVGSTTAVVSNIFLGQGPWTIWQMLAWGLCGLVSGLLGRGRLMKNRFVFAIYCAIWGFLFGWIMNLYFVLGFIKPLTFKSFFLAYSSSVGFDALHALGNFVFAYGFGLAFMEMLRKYKSRLFFETETQGGDLLRNVSGMSKGDALVR